MVTKNSIRGGFIDIIYNMEILNPISEFFVLGP